MNNQMLLGEKLKQVREELGLLQSEMAEQAGVYQNDVSTLERFEKKHVPVRYIIFIYKKGYDINSLFGPGPLRKRVTYAEPNHISLAAEPDPSTNDLATIINRLKAIERRLDGLED